MHANGEKNDVVIRAKNRRTRCDVALAQAGLPVLLKGKDAGGTNGECSMLLMGGRQRVGGWLFFLRGFEFEEAVDLRPGTAARWRGDVRG